MAELSYNVIKNILEHMSLEKRVELSVCCPVIKPIEPKIDVSMDRLSITNTSVTFDDLEFYTFHFDELPELSRSRTFVVKKGGEEIYIENHVEGIELGYFKERMKKILNVWLGNRGTIRVRVLEVGDAIGDLDGIPDGVRFECKQLNVRRVSEPTIDRWPRGFDENMRRRIKQVKTVREIARLLPKTPLEKMSIVLTGQNDRIMREYLVRTAKQLEIRNTRYTTHSIARHLTRLTTQHVHYELNEKYGNTADQDLLAVARHWLRTCPEVGRLFTVRTKTYEFAFHFKEYAMGDLNAEEATFVENNRYRVKRHCWMVTMANGNELVAYGKVSTSERNVVVDSMLYMQVMPSGTCVRI